MTTYSTGKYSVAEEEKPCVGCGRNYHGTVRSKYCSSQCQSAVKHAKRMADPSRKLVAEDRMRRARATYNSKHPHQYIPVTEISEKAKTSRRQRSRKYLANKANVLSLSYTHEQLQSKVAYWGNRCWICLGGWDAMDHVKPLAKGGPNILSNMRPICTPCNSRKRDKWPYNPARP